MWTKNFQMYKLGLEKAREFQKNIYIRFIDHAKALHYVDHKKLRNFL